MRKPISSLRKEVRRRVEERTEEVIERMKRKMIGGFALLLVTIIIDNKIIKFIIKLWKLFRVSYIVKI